MLKREGRIRQVVENRFELVVEERKPMLDPRVAASLAHRFIKKIVGCGRPELRDVPGAKPANGFGHKLKFSDRDEIKSAQLLFSLIWVCASNERIVSSASPKKSSRTGISMPGG